MISIQNSLSLEERKTFSNSNNSSKKRKWQSEEGGEDDCSTKVNDPEAKSTEPTLDIDLHLETPLPIDWQRCLDLQSGQVHFFNTRTQKRTCRDPRGSPEPVSSRTMSLDLELNLPFDSFQDHLDNEEKNPPPNSTDSCSNPKPILSRSLSWVSLDADEQEMLAAVCMRCHMLVMLCKSSPTCPNCKFLNPTDQIPSIKLDSPLL
ncbi:hypothetical protein MRB53_034229 [Persea americana]|uniref:Uncharacterized protein n=1 Tax=Persea americana TaxID=3435 RepID=A0ACC2KWW5_PERAE|nr:hypothetical protein MRB53_034229 [Persea americana]